MPTWRRRAAAAGALALLAGAAILAVALATRGFPRGVPVVACAIGAGLAAWHAVIRRGPIRWAGLALAAALLVAAVVLVATNDRLVEDAVLIGTVALAVVLARHALTVRATLPAATPPRHPVLFWNPRSGGGKATRFDLEREARARDIEPVELKPGEDLRVLVRAALADGADGLAMAGGDGSQAVVAEIASERGLPYACIPAGTRNHFALDLGVDRDDVVGALDAFVDGGERLVDLADVNGRVFVNNVSLGVYADAVQRNGYREAKIRTILDALPDGGETPTVLVSNNAYRLGRAIGSGTRPRLDAGLLGVAVLDPSKPGRWHEALAEHFEVASDEPVNAGIDGEAVVLDPPLEFSIHPGALRVRIARAHPGASPSAAVPDSLADTLRALVRIARANH